MTMCFKCSGDKIYGEIQSPLGNIICEGKTLEEVKELAKEVDESQTTIYDVVGDLAFAPKLLMDMANYIEELENKLYGDKASAAG